MNIMPSILLNVYKDRGTSREREREREKSTYVRIRKYHTYVLYLNKNLKD